MSVSQIIVAGKSIMILTILLILHTVTKNIIIHINMIYQILAYYNYGNHFSNSVNAKLYSTIS